jgi:hypothetical protein
MPTQGPNYPSSEADDASIGTVSWSTLGNAGAEDEVWDSAVMTATTGKVNSIRLVVGGTISGADQSDGATIPPDPHTGEADTTVSYFWSGLTYTAAQINATTFGVAYSVIDNSNVVSHYLKLTNYGFAIGPTTTVSMVQADVSHHWGGFDAFVDSIALTVTFSGLQDGIFGTSHSVSSAASVCVAAHARPQIVAYQCSHRRRLDRFLRPPVKRPSRRLRYVALC